MKTKVIPNGTIVRFHICGQWRYGIVQDYNIDPYDPDSYDIRDVASVEALGP